jgi:hypothetical protein
MHVNFIRHGSRTPGKIYKEVNSHFGDKTYLKKLTLNGFKQMILLGKYIRKHIIEKNNLIDLNNISKEFLIFSSPSNRAVESSVAYSQGLFPEAIFKTYYIGDDKYNSNGRPPIISFKKMQF